MLAYNFTSMLFLLRIINVFTRRSKLMKTLCLFSRVLPLTLLLSAPIYGELKPEIVPTKIESEQSHVKELKSKKELEEAISNNKALAIKVFTDWCGACKMMEPDYEKAAKTHAGKVAAYCLNADNAEFKDFLKMFDVTGYPMVLYIRKETGPLLQQKYEPKVKAGSRIEYACPEKEYIRKETGTRPAEMIESSMASLLRDTKSRPVMQTIEVIEEDEEETPKKEVLPVRERKRTRRSHRRTRNEESTPRRSRRRMRKEGLPVRERMTRYYEEDNNEE